MIFCKAKHEKRLPVSALSAILTGCALSQILTTYPVPDFDSQLFRSRVVAAESVARQGPGAFQFGPDGSARLSVGDTSYAAGRFSTPSLSELKAQLQKIPRSSQAALKFSILLGRGPLSDIQYLEAHADGQTTFQLASQFNTLEAPFPGVVAVADYFDDRTQGPLGVLPAFAGALLRHYAAPTQVSSSSGQRFIQTEQRQLNLLADVLPASSQMQSGYLMSQNSADPEALAQALEQHFEQIRIGWHRDLQSMGNGKNLDQVLTSTLAGGSYSRQDTTRPPWTLIQRQLLRGAYLGSLLAAANAGHSQIVLTAIGGGVFDNTHAEIWQAILWSLQEVQPLLSQPLHVILNLREFDLDTKQMEAATQAYGGQLLKL